MCSLLPGLRADTPACSLLTCPPEVSPCRMLRCQRLCSGQRCAAGEDAERDARWLDIPSTRQLVALWQPFPENVCGCPVVTFPSLVRKLAVPQLLQASGAETPHFLCFLKEETSSPAAGLGKLNKVTQRLKGKRGI